MVIHRQKSFKSCTPRLKPPQPYCYRLQSEGIVIKSIKVTLGTIQKSNLFSYLILKSKKLWLSNSYLTLNKNQILGLGPKVHWLFRALCQVMAKEGCIYCGAETESERTSKGSKEGGVTFSVPRTFSLNSH